MIKNKLIAVIGGGPCGVGMGKWLAQTGLDFEIIERESGFGGLWNIDSKFARRVYQSTHLISCSSITELSDHPMPDNYPPYPNHKLMLQYIQSIAEKYNLSEKTIFNTEVMNANLVENSEIELTFRSGEKKRYGAMVLATGLLNNPVLPSYSGQFTGELLHSIDYKNIDAYKNKRVLIVGSGNTGCDIAVDLCRYADKVYHSCRRAYHYMPKFIHGKPTQEWLIDASAGDFSNISYWKYVEKEFQKAGFAPQDYGLPKPDHEIFACHPIMNSQILFHIGHGDIVYKPDIACFQDKAVTFVDGSTIDVDTIIYATGFRPYFPFLNPTQFNNENIFQETYTRCLHKKLDNVFFLGYFNSPSGLGNLLNFGGKLLSLLIKAYFLQHPMLSTIQKLKNGPEPNLGNEIYIQSDRHQHEYDLWKTVRFLRSMIDEIEGGFK